MPLRTADEYRAGLVDGRRLYYQGRPVDDINQEPDLKVAVDHAAIDFDLAHDPDHRDLAVATDPDTGEEYNAAYRIPRNAEDVMARSKLIEAGTAAGGTVVTLIHEIGTDGMFAMLRVLEGEGRERAEAFYRHCRDGDLAVAVAQTDVKGDRSKAPHQQDDPDLYVRVVDRSDDGIVVRGAKCHTTSSANGDEIIVLPTRAMGPDDADYAVAFAVPANTAGLSLYVSAYGGGGGGHDAFELPLSSRHKMLETLTVFDDVFVPWERVFLCREPEKAGALALTFVEYHRFTAVSYKLPLVDAFVGAAAQIAEMNGVMKAGHIRDKLTHLVTYAETVRALTEAAGLAVPDRRARHRLPGPHDHEHGQVHLRHRLPPGRRVAAGLRRRPAGHGPGRGGLGRRRDPAGAREVLPRRLAGSRAPGDDEPHLGPDGQGLRRLPRRARRPRRRLDRGREAADAPLLHGPPRPRRHRLRPKAGRPRLTVVLAP